MIVSDLMVDFPPIAKQDNPQVLAAYVTTHYEKIGEIINLSSIPDTQAGVSLRVAKKWKSKKGSSEAIDEVEPKPKKAKDAPQLNVVELALPTIQEEVADLDQLRLWKREQEVDLMKLLLLSSSLRFRRKENVSGK